MNKKKHKTIPNGGTPAEISIGDFLGGAHNLNLFTMLLAALAEAYERCQQPITRLARELRDWLQPLLASIRSGNRIAAMTAGMFGGILLRVLRKRSRLAASLPAVFDTMDAPGGIARVVATHQDKGRDPNDARMLLIVWVLIVFVLFGRMRLFWTSAVTRHLVDGLPPLTRAKSSHDAWWLVGERLLLNHYGKWSALPGKEIENVKRGRTTSTVNPKRLAAYHDSRIREEVREEFMRVCDEVTRDGLIAPGFAWKK